MIQHNNHHLFKQGGNKNMKKLILCLSLFVLVSTCFVTNAMAIPSITNVHGGLGVSATVENARGRDWTIYLQGPAVILGSKTAGMITRKSETIRTPIAPPAFGAGPIKVIIKINRLILPDIITIKSGIMLGPFVLLGHNIPSGHHS